MSADNVIVVRGLTKVFHGTPVLHELNLDVSRGETLVIAPCVPDAWPGFSIGYRLPGEDTRYEILAGNPGHRGRGVASATLDGEPVAVREGAARIPLVHDGRLHRVAILLGAGEEPGA